ncbi:hypothetical protein D4764_04G0005640 [Takifugu flavidus]|uniref:Uncharacterized protein n=1 Tax=Takifugu flavidus TaxID=433684 RepID=A0A5C6N867_9TELE|nr:hypothetical protein D4764_04G0005640 [Takifugu flavidus]
MWLKSPKTSSRWLQPTRLEDGVRGPPLSHAVISVSPRSFLYPQTGHLHIRGRSWKTPSVHLLGVHSSSTDPSSPAVMHLHIWAEVTEEFSGSRRRRRPMVSPVEMGKNRLL